MKVIRDIVGGGVPKKAVVTLGNFDGVHTGHKRILERVCSRAKELGVESLVYTFEPHPLKVLAPAKSPPLLTTLEEKVSLIEECGISTLVVASFTKEFASRRPDEFVGKVLAEELEASEVIIGHDFSFGRAKRGTIEHLKELGMEYGFSVEVVKAHEMLGGVVSSSRIRKLIGSGDVTAAAKLLGRRHSIKGRVVRGRSLGKEIGFPTANLKVTEGLVPQPGVYAVTVEVHGTGSGELTAVANIGSAPTFDRKKTLLEVHIIDFEGSIYGKDIVVDFYEKLREEERFSSPQELGAQIARDVKRATEATSKKNRATNTASVRD